MINLLIDILIYNYTFFKSYFFLFNIFNKSPISSVLLSLIVDIFIIKSCFFCTIFTIIFLVIKKFVLINNFLKRILFWLIMITIFYFLINYNNLFLRDYLNVVFTNIIYFLISYKMAFKNINFYG